MKNKTLLYTNAFKGTKMHSQQGQMMWRISSICNFEAATMFTSNTKVAASPLCLLNLIVSVQFKIVGQSLVEK